MTDRDSASPEGRSDGAEGETNDADQDRRAFLESNELVTTDSVAGETVLPGVGDGNDGPTGGAPAEGSPSYDEHAGELGSDDATDDAGTLVQPEALDAGLDGQHHER